MRLNESKEQINQPEECFVIHSASEEEASDGFGYWSNEEGWVGIQSATKFTEVEMKNFDLPMATENDASWVCLSDIRESLSRKP